MVELRPLESGSLSTILEESTGSTSSTCIDHTDLVLATTDDLYFLEFPLGFGSAIFAVSLDEPSVTGEAPQERAVHIERNAQQAHQRVQEQDVADVGRNAR